MAIRRTGSFAVLATALSVAAASCAGTSSGGGGGAPISEADPSALGGQQVVKELEELYAAAEENGAETIVVYGATANYRDDVYAKFAERFPGITVQSEQLTGPNLTSKLNQEYSSGEHIADIAHTGSTTMADIADTGRFRSFDPVSAEGLPERYIADEGLFRADAASIFGILYNTEKIDDAAAPSGWNDLLDSRWQGKLVLDDPTSMGSTAGALGRLLNDPRYDGDWVQSLGRNTHLVSQGQSSNQVITGAYPVSPFYPYIFYKQDEEKGAPLGFVFPVEGGNRLAAHYLGLLSEAPHPNAAKLLITWLFTPEAQRLISQTGDYPTMPGAPGPGDLPKLSGLDLLEPIPLDRVTEVYANKLEVLQRAFSR